MVKHGIKMEYSRITPDVYLGSNMCCTIHAKELFDAGINADLSLQKEPHDHIEGLDHYLLLPVTDTYAPSVEQMRVGISFMHKVIQQGGKVYVHCKNGHGRSPAMVAAFLLDKGMNIEEALTIVQQQRPEVHLNKRQLTALEKLKSKL